MPSDRRHARVVERAITGSHEDDVGDWVAELACGAGLVCPDCGAIVDGGGHRPGCRTG